MFNGIIDLSSDQGSFDLSTLKSQGIIAVIHRTGIGESPSDSDYVSRQAEAASAGLLWGAYHVGTAAPIANQLTNFASVAAPLGDNTLVALDFEPISNDPSDTMTVAGAEQWVTLFQQQYGFLPLIYGSSLLQQIPSGSILAQCKLWIANYNPVSQPPLPPAFSEWTLWQYTESSTINDQACDQEYFNGMKLQLEQQWPLR